MWPLALRMEKMNITCVVDVGIFSSKLGPALVEVEKLLFKLGVALIRLGFVAVIGLRTGLVNLVITIGLGCMVMFMTKVGLTLRMGDIGIMIGLFHCGALHSADDGMGLHFGRAPDPCLFLRHDVGGGGCVELEMSQIASIRAMA